MILPIICRARVRPSKQPKSVFDGAGHRFGERQDSCFEDVLGSFLVIATGKFSSGFLFLQGPRRKVGLVAPEPRTCRVFEVQVPVAELLGVSPVV